MAVTLARSGIVALLPGASQLAASVEAGAVLSPFDRAIRGRQLHAGPTERKNTRLLPTSNYRLGIRKPPLSRLAGPPR